MADIGHNSAASADVLNGQSQQLLRSLVSRIENLNEDKAGIAADLKEVFAEVKGYGFSAPIVRKIVKLRAQDRGKRQEEEALLDLYLSAIGEGEL